MGHYCRICERQRPNEKFSGKGHNIHVCKDCMRLPKDKRQFIEERDEIEVFLSHTGQWIETERGLTIDQCLKANRDDGLYCP